jgi:hypothetical protein
MSGFEFVFSLFGLLLGFSLVEVIAGFGRAVEANIRGSGTSVAGPRIGWLTPLLALFVTFNLISFWTAAWALRDEIPVLYLPMLFGMFVTGGYYFAAALVFPREFANYADLDNHYFEVKRWVVAVIGICNALGAVGAALAGIDPLAVVGAAALNLAFYALLAGLFFARGKRTNIVLLAAAVALYPAAAVVAWII